jgi:hypothetical protein
MRLAWHQDAIAYIIGPWTPVGCCPPASRAYAAPSPRGPAWPSPPSPASKPARGSLDRHPATRSATSVPPNWSTPPSRELQLSVAFLELPHRSGMRAAGKSPAQELDSLPRDVPGEPGTAKVCAP